MTKWQIVIGCVPLIAFILLIFDALEEKAQRKLRDKILEVLKDGKEWYGPDLRREVKCSNLSRFYQVLSRLEDLGLVRHRKEESEDNMGGDHFYKSTFASSDSEVI